MMPFSFDTFDEIADGLDAAAGWFQSIGISTTGTRLNNLQQRIRALLADLSSRPREEVVERWSDNLTYYTLADARGFMRIAQELGKMPQRLPMHSLRTILSGPLDPTEENPSDASVQARNIFVELELAADLSAKGLEIVGFDDVKAKFDDRHLFFECKRIHSHSRVGENVSKAISQLSRKMLDDQARGLITIVLDRLIGVDRMILRVCDDGEVPRAAEEKIEEFLERYANDFRAPVDTRILATCFVLHFLVYHVPRNMIGSAYMFAIVPYVGLGILEYSDRRLLEGFAAFANTQTRVRN